MGKAVNNRCPICGQLLDERGVCRRCGFDDSVNYEDYQTLGRIPENVYSIEKKQSEYHNQKVRDAVREEIEKFEEERKREENARKERERVERERAEKARNEKEKAESEKVKATRQQAEKAARKAAEQAKRAAEAEQRKTAAQADSNKQSTSTNKKSGFNPVLIVIPLVLAVVVGVGVMISGGLNSGKSSSNGNNATVSSANQAAQPATTTAQQETTAAINNNADTSEQVEVGDIITFGHYEQDNDANNGKEDIEWIVLEVSDDGKQALIISRYGLDAVPYNTNWVTTTWDKCSLRSWLNDEFLNFAFDSTEEKRILEVTVSADANPKYSTDPGNDVTGKIFLLSIEEVNSIHYFSSVKARKCVPTEYAIAQGASRSSSQTLGGKATCWWWLRSAGEDSAYAAGVSNLGNVYCNGYDVHYSGIGVRPALWINL